MDEHPYIAQARAEIAEWESQGPGYLSQVADFVLWPAEKAAELLIPNAAQEAVGKSIHTCLEGLSGLSTHTIDEAKLQLKVQERFAELRAGTDTTFAELRAADEQAQECWNWNIGYAAAEGGATGGFGFFGLAADVPALFTILLRLIQEIATCYGYKLTRDGEGEYVLQILRAGSAANAKVKMEFVIALKELEQILIQISWKKMSAELAAKQISRLSLLAAIRQFAKSLGIQLTKRKALQLVPIVGAIVGASLNATLANDIGRAAYMSYRRRWLAERKT